MAPIEDLETEAVQIRAELASRAECSEYTNARMARLEEIYRDLDASQPTSKVKLVTRPVQVQAQPSLAVGGRAVYTLGLIGSPEPRSVVVARDWAARHQVGFQIRSELEWLPAR